MTVHDRQARIAGQPMRWLEAGSGWPLVLLHAFPLSADMWRAELERVPDGWHFIAPDLDPGFRAAAPADGEAGITIDTYAQRVSALLDDLQIERAIIGGLSMGGYITFALYRLEPQRFTGMILANTRPQADSTEARAGREALRATLASGGAAAVADAMIPRLLSARARREQPDVVAAVRRMIEARDPHDIDAAISALLSRPDSTPQLSRVSIPVLLVAGELDEVTPPPVARDMRQRLTRAYLAEIEGAGHLSNLECPGEFSRILHDFLLAHI